MERKVALRLRREVWHASHGLRQTLARMSLRRLRHHRSSSRTTTISNSSISCSFNSQITISSVIFVQQTCSISPPSSTRGPMSRPTVLSKTSIMNLTIKPINIQSPFATHLKTTHENKERVSAASHRPFDDSSRMNACCAFTSRNCVPFIR